MTHIMAALLNLLLALLPGGLCIHDHSPLIQHTAARAAPPSEKSAANSTVIPVTDWKCNKMKYNLCMPRNDCKILGGMEFRDIHTNTNCPLEELGLTGEHGWGWVCCILKDTNEKERERETADHQRKHRLANWADWRMNNKIDDDNLESMVKKKCGATEGELDTWFSAGCRHACAEDTNCLKGCKTCKQLTAKSCDELKMQQTKSAYSLFDEICHTAKSDEWEQEEKQEEEPIKKKVGKEPAKRRRTREQAVTKPAKETKKEKEKAKGCDAWHHKYENRDTYGSAQFCEDQTSWEGENPDKCDGACKAECNRCVRDKTRHKCKSCEVKEVKDGCELFCSYGGRAKL